MSTVGVMKWLRGCMSANPVPESVPPKIRHLHLVSPQAVVVDPASAEQVPESMPPVPELVPPSATPVPCRAITGRKLTPRNVANAVLEFVRDEALDHVYTVAEIDAWVARWSEESGTNLGSLRLSDIRSSIKRASGVRYELRRIVADPAFEDLRRRYALRGAVPQRAWVFMIGAAD